MNNNNNDNVVAEDGLLPRSAAEDGLLPRSAVTRSRTQLQNTQSALDGAEHAGVVEGDRTDGDAKQKASVRTTNDNNNSDNNENENKNQKTQSKTQQTVSSHPATETSASATSSSGANEAVQHNMQTETRRGHSDELRARAVSTTAVVPETAGNCDTNDDDDDVWAFESNAASNRHAAALRAASSVQVRGGRTVGRGQAMLGDAAARKMISRNVVGSGHRLEQKQSEKAPATSSDPASGRQWNEHDGSSLALSATFVGQLPKHEAESCSEGADGRPRPHAATSVVSGDVDVVQRGRQQQFAERCARDELVNTRLRLHVERVRMEIERRELQERVRQLRRQQMRSQQVMSELTKQQQPFNGRCLNCGEVGHRFRQPQCARSSEMAPVADAGCARRQQQRVWRRMGRQLDREAKVTWGVWDTDAVIRQQHQYRTVATLESEQG